MRWTDYLSNRFLRFPRLLNCFGVFFFARWKRRHDSSLPWHPLWEQPHRRGGSVCLSGPSCWRRNKWKTGSGDGAEACVRQTEARRYWSVCQTRQLGGGLEGRQTSPLSLLRRCTLGLKVHPATLTMECAHCEKNHGDRAGTEGFFFLSRMTRDSEGRVWVTQCAECIKNTINLSCFM